MCVSYVLLSYVWLFLTSFGRIFLHTAMNFGERVSTIKISAKWLHQKQLSYHVDSMLLLCCLISRTMMSIYVCAIYFWNSCFNNVSQAWIRINFTETLIWCQLQRNIFQLTCAFHSSIYLYVCHFEEKSGKILSISSTGFYPVSSSNVDTENEIFDCISTVLITNSIHSNNTELKKVGLQCSSHSFRVEQTPPSLL